MNDTKNPDAERQAALVALQRAQIMQRTTTNQPYNDYLVRLTPQEYAALAQSQPSVEKESQPPEITSAMTENGMATFACDDDRDTTLRMVQDGQGDVWISIASSKPEIFKGVRLRTKQGGGADANMGLRHHLAKFLCGLKSDKVLADDPKPTEQGPVEDLDRALTYVEHWTTETAHKPSPFEADDLYCFFQVIEAARRYRELVREENNG